MKKDILMERVGYYPFPLFEDTLLGITHENDRDYERRKTIMPDMEKLYRSMIAAPVCQERIGKALRLIMKHDYAEGAVLWHCSEGKDRAGLIAALLLTALDVNEEEILEDYLLTNETNEARAKYYRQKVIENGGDPEVAVSVYNAFVAKEEYLKGAFDEMKACSGNVPAYMMEKLCIPEELTASFKTRLLEG